jgi:hypothetical protein
VIGSHAALSKTLEPMGAAIGGALLPYGHGLSHALYGSPYDVPSLTLCGSRQAVLVHARDSLPSWPLPVVPATTPIRVATSALFLPAGPVCVVLMRRTQPLLTESAQPLSANPGFFICFRRSEPVLPVSACETGGLRAGFANSSGVLLTPVSSLVQALVQTPSNAWAWVCQ